MKSNMASGSLAWMTGYHSSRLGTPKEEQSFLWSPLLPPPPLLNAKMYSLGFLIWPLLLLFWHTWSQRFQPSATHIDSLLKVPKAHLSLSSFSRNLLYLNLLINRIQSVIYLCIKRRDLEVTREFSLSLTPTWNQSPTPSSSFLMSLISALSPQSLCSYIRPLWLTWVLDQGPMFPLSPLWLIYLCLPPSLLLLHLKSYF